jgi:hypothetical protein
MDPEFFSARFATDFSQPASHQSGTAVKKERQHESNRTATREILKLCVPNNFGLTKISIQHCVKQIGWLDCQNRASDGDTRKAA